MLAYQLVAHGIGGRTVRELNEGISARDEGMDVDEFITWAAYLTLEPLPEKRADVHTAMVLQQNYNMNRGKNPARRLSQFMPEWGGTGRPAQTTEQARQALKINYLSMGGKLEDIR